MTAAIEPRTLKDVQGVLDERRKGMKALLDKYPDISSDEVKEIQRLDQEINDLADREKQLMDVERIRGEQAKKAGFDDFDTRDRRRDADPTGDGSSKGADTWETLADLILNSVAVKGYKRGMRQGPVAELNLSQKQIDALLVYKTTLTTTGAPPESTRSGIVLPGVLRRPTVSALIPQGTTSQNAFKYLEETTTTNGFDTVAEGAAKPENAIAFTERTAPIRKIAGILKITDETLEDEPLLRSYIEQRLRLFLMLAEETQLLNGDGNAPDITGLITIAGNTQPKGSDPTPDAFYKAMTQIRVDTFLEPSGHVIHPNDWQEIRLLRTADGVYIWGNPSEVGVERMWGLPVVSTTAMTEGTGLTAAFDTAMMIVRRMGVAFDIATQNEDDWKKNIVAMRLEERLGLPVFRPDAVATVTGI
jgi:HK97 family phage major capsid protein